MVEGLNTTSARGLRDRALVLTFFGSGLRVAELISLKIEDLDLEHFFVTVRQGKRSKDRIAPLNPVAVAALKAYLEIGRPQLIHDEPDDPAADAGADVEHSPGKEFFFCSRS